MSDSSNQELAKDLGPLAALTIGVGTMIGAGIFVLPSQAAEAAGPGIIFSFIIGGFISLLTALSASELGTAMPKAGGAYYYINHALGPIFGSIAGWGNWIGLAFASAFYMIGFGEYLSTFLPIPNIALGLITLSDFQVGGLLAGVLFIAINYIGAKETGRAQNFIVITLVSILTIFSILGFFHIDISTLKPIFPSEVGGASAVLPATGLIFVSFLGFVQITTVAEELKNPGRNLPLAVIGSVVIVTVIYAVIMVVLMGVINWQILAESESPVLNVAEIAFSSIDLSFLGIEFLNLLNFSAIGIGLLTFAGLLATASSANASILASSRINFAMGRDKLVSNKLNKIHPRFTTPYRSIAVTGGFIIVFIIIGDVATLARAGSILHLIVYGLLNIAVIVMREFETKEYQPSFKVPLYPYIPLLGAVTSFGLILSMDIPVIILSLIFVLAGTLWYFGYARGQTEKQGVLSKNILKKPEKMPNPAVSIASNVNPSSSKYRVMVALANPEHEKDLISLGSMIAKNRQGILDVINIVSIPDQVSLEHIAENPEEYGSKSEKLLNKAKEDAKTFGVDAETHTIYSHRSFEEIFDAAKNHNADIVIMGWGDKSYGSPGRAESVIDDLAMDLPSDFLVFKDLGFDPEKILLPTAGGPDSDLSAEIAKIFIEQYNSKVTLLHVSDSHKEGKDFLENWAKQHNLSDVNLKIEKGDVEESIEKAAKDHSMIIIGATERGLLSRLLKGSLVLDVLYDVDCSVIISEKKRKRGLLDRLFGK